MGILGGWQIFAVLGLLVALAGAAWKLERNGYERGAAAIRQEWQADSQRAQDAASAERKRQEALRQREDADNAKRLAAEKKRASTLMASLEAHIRAAGSAAQCPMPDGVRDAWNAANRGPAGEGDGTGSVPSGSRGAAHAR